MPNQHKLGLLGQKKENAPSPYDHFQITKDPYSDKNPFTFKIVNFPEKESSIREEEVKKLAQQYTDMLNNLYNESKLRTEQAEQKQIDLHTKIAEASSEELNKLYNEKEN